MIQLTSLDGEKKLFNHLCIGKVETDSEGTSVYVGGERYTVKESKEWIDNYIERATPIVRAMTKEEYRKQSQVQVTILRSEYEKLKKDSELLDRIESEHGWMNDDAAEYLRSERG